MPVNELQLGLIGAGVVVVGAVWGYNFWQERQHRKVAEKIFKGGQPDVLLGGQEGDEPEASGERVERAERVERIERGGERIEPSVSHAGESGDERIEPGMGPVAGAAMGAMESDSSVAAPASAPPADWADEIAECMLRVEFAQGVSAPALWSVQAAWSDGLGKTLTWMGYDAEGRKWKKLTAHDAGHYSHVVAALQLADRQGAVSDNDLAVFLQGVQRIAQQFDGTVDLPQVQDLVAHAQSLDGFCASVDVQLAVNVVETAGGSFMGTKLRGLAESAGMTLEGDGLFHARDENGAELFALGNLGNELFAPETLKTMAAVGISFVLDVPRVADGPEVFNRMATAAKLMAQSLGGTLVDGQRHVLSDAMIDGIRSKVAEVQRQMTANQIPPGSPRALRLFS